MEEAKEVIFQFVKNIHLGQVLVFDKRKNAKLNRLAGAVKIINILFWMIKQYVYKNADEWLNDYQFRNSFLTEGNKTFESVNFCNLRKVSINSISSKRCRRITNRVNINHNYFYYSMHRVAPIVLFLMVHDCFMDHVDAFNPITSHNMTGFSNNYKNAGLRSSFHGPITKYSISKRSVAGKNPRKFCN